MNAILEKKPFGYYRLRESRLKELHNYIKKYHTVDKMINNVEGKRIYDIFFKYNDSIDNAIVELGYDIDKIRSIKSKGYYNDFTKIEEKLWGFINEFNRFPTKLEIIKSLGIDQRHIDKNGGINKLKEKINYNDNMDLIDNRGDYNRSIMEWQIANYFISQGLKDKYKREQYPFPKEEGYYRSDFTFYLDNQKEIHIEVWGFQKDDYHNEVAIKYQETRIKKELLYDKYNNIILISINYELFQQSYENIIKSLYNIFKDYLKLQYNNIDYRIIIPPSKKSDDEIFNEIIQFSIDGKTFPTLKEFNNPVLIQELRNRGYSYLEFAKKYNKKLVARTEEWGKEVVFEYFFKIIKQGESINKKTMKQFHNNLYDYVIKIGFVDIKLEFFNKFINDLTLPDNEIMWLNNIFNKRNIKNTKVSLINQIDAKNILINYRQYVSL